VSFLRITWRREAALKQEAAKGKDANDALAALGESEAGMLRLEEAVAAWIHA
jgi:hypothetical protein